MNNDFLIEIKRGLVNLISEEELIKKLSYNRALRIKFGIDPTASDLHLGHTVLLNKLELFQKKGHKIVFIIGDFTSRIGDPSGRSETRPILSDDEILFNAEKIKSQISKILDINKLEIHYNSEWLTDIFSKKNIFSTLKNIFAKYTVQQLMERDDFTKRKKEGIGISLLELLYPIFQGYDSVAVNSDIEIGGSDQLFNLLIGRQLQQDFGKEPQVIMTLPLLLGIDGVRKMSKSYKNYIGLTEEPKQIYGKLMSIPDSLMLSYFELLTDLDLDKIKELIKQQPKQAKSKLSYYITAKCYNETIAKTAQEEFDNIFSKKKLPENIPEFILEKGEKISHIISDLAKISKKEVKRLLLQNAIEITFDRENFKVVNEDILINNDFIVRVGKYRFFSIKFSKKNII